MYWRSLAKQWEFKAVYERGAKIVGQLLVVYLLAAEDDAFGVVASRKIGNAVHRNRAKRLLREARRQGCLGNRDGREIVWRRFFPAPRDENEPRGLWVVLVARQAISAASCAEVVSELEFLLRPEP